jgi:hypothetical protein
VASKKKKVEEEEEEEVIKQFEVIIYNSNISNEFLIPTKSIKTP